RFSRDWSSDVCSSDLLDARAARVEDVRIVDVCTCTQAREQPDEASARARANDRQIETSVAHVGERRHRRAATRLLAVRNREEHEIGRASCRATVQATM